MPWASFCLVNVDYTDVNYIILKTHYKKLTYLLIFKYKQLYLLANLLASTVTKYVDDDDNDDDDNDDDDDDYI